MCRQMTLSCDIFSYSDVAIYWDQADDPVELRRWLGAAIERVFDAFAGIRRVRGCNRARLNMAIQYTEALDRTFHALGDASRRRMLALLHQNGSCTAGELGAIFETAQPTISRHLRVLEEAELVTRRVEGRRHMFTLAPSRITQAQRWLERHLAFWNGSLDQLEAVLDEMKRTEEGGGNG